MTYPLRATALAALALMAACGADNRWAWVPVNGAVCRDGSPAGFAIRPHTNSDNLLIILGGGPICIDARTCAESGAPLSFAAKRRPRSDIFADRPDNPFADWNQVWVPHCTDDYHVGSARDVTVPGLRGVQQFVGHANMSLFLEQIKAKFSGPTRVVLSGHSSGGQGAIANLPQVRRAFGRETNMILFVDSGPPVPSSETRGILTAMIELWGADQTMLSECGEACGEPANFFFDYFAWLVKTYSGEIHFSFSAFLNDPIEIREFGISQDAWVTHLESVRSEILDGSQSSTFYHDSRGHTVINSMYTIRVGELTVAEWLGLVLDDKPQHVGP